MEESQKQPASEDPTMSNLMTTEFIKPSKCQFECSSVLIFIMLGFIFLSFAMVELITNFKQQSYRASMHYDPTTNQILSDKIDVYFNRGATVAIYLTFQKFTQYNYTYRYQGDNIEDFDQEANSCNHFRFNKDINKQVSILNNPLQAGAFAIPCGSFSAMFVGNNIRLLLNNGSYSMLSSENLNIFDYHAMDLSPSNQWVSLKNTLFQQWMEQNVIITTTKLMGRVVGNFQGKIQLLIQTNNNFPQQFGSLSVFFTDNSALGGFNQFFCILNFAEGFLMFLLALAVYNYSKIEKQQFDNVTKNTQFLRSTKASPQNFYDKTVQF